MYDVKNNFFKSTQIQPAEVKGALVSFLFIFVLMTSYMIMKPVRDALPSDWGDVSLAQQWTYTFFASIAAVFVYNLCASFVSLSKLVPSVFVFFAATFLGIYAAFQGKLMEVTTLGKVFYVWSSVFSLFQISVFWSFISQHYSKDQSKRVFSFINVGASAGALAGPGIIILLSHWINEENILLITASVLMMTLPLIAILNREFAKKGTADKQLNLNPNPLSGIEELFTHKRLLGIAGFIFFFTGVASFLYFAQKELLVEYSRPERKELLGKVEFATNFLTIMIGLFVTNQIARRFGMATTLSLVPFVICALLLLVSASPAIMFILALQVVRRAGNYAITRPAREMLFTAVDKEARFKTKPIIDVVVYRGGDVAWIWLIAWLGDGGLHLGLTPILCIGAGVTFIWGAFGIFLGKRHDADDLPDE